jgi:hypothetical protein
VRPIIASAIFALGCSFALVALRGGDFVLAAAALVAACSTAALMIRALAPAKRADDLGEDSR